MFGCCVSWIVGYRCGNCSLCWNSVPVPCTTPCFVFMLIVSPRTPLINNRRRTRSESGGTPRCLSQTLGITARTRCRRWWPSSPSSAPCAAPRCSTPSQASWSRGWWLSRAFRYGMRSVPLWSCCPAEGFSVDRYSTVKEEGFLSLKGRQYSDGCARMVISLCEVGGALLFLPGTSRYLAPRSCSLCKTSICSFQDLTVELLQQRVVQPAGETTVSIGTFFPPSLARLCLPAPTPHRSTNQRMPRQVSTDAMAQLTDAADYDVRRKVAEMATQVYGCTYVKIANRTEFLLACLPVFFKILIFPQSVSGIYTSDL